MRRRAHPSRYPVRSRSPPLPYASPSLTSFLTHIDIPIQLTGPKVFARNHIPTCSQHFVAFENPSKRHPSSPPAQPPNIDSPDRARGPLPSMAFPNTYTLWAGPSRRTLPSLTSCTTRIVRYLTVLSLLTLASSQDDIGICLPARPGADYAPYVAKPKNLYHWTGDWSRYRAGWHATHPWDRVNLLLKLWAVFWVMRLYSIMLRDREEIRRWWAKHNEDVARDRREQNELTITDENGMDCRMELEGRVDKRIRVMGRVAEEGEFWVEETKEEEYWDMR
ncbi:hypothetical protein BCR34DRAFT_587017 [Clohesyomyces aquaticus]|uniref:Uncharacterized protein n=1 Tax=Clohesyomyces aquaticus TaxID=1231657 RepID=A0A1Y1ZR90_9PLEO|nr:hypothetical protein BCR34DRAFT_587017 [Clohesyomyces aquaticus]